MEGKRSEAKGKRKWNGAKIAACSILLLPFSVCLVSGCRSCDRVEAELRARENEVRDLREELNRSEAINEGLLRELQVVRPNASAAKISPEHAAHTMMIKEVVLGRQTGGHDDDDCPGDEALQVVVEPRDPDGHALKAPGTLQVAVLEIQPEGLKVPLSTWDVPPEQLRKTWKNGLLSTGYYVLLPWKNWPTVNKLRVVARLTLADGRTFEADKDITIRLTRNRKPAPASETPRTAPAEETPLPLPQPRKVEPPPQTETRLPRPAQPAPAAPVEPATLWQPSSPSRFAGAVQMLPPARQ